jgi:sodium-dependent dicarboxylate transporter 2/3/5
MRHNTIIISLNIAINNSLISSSQESQAGYLLLLMIVYWCSEVLPLSITALIPVFMLPFMGIASATEVTHNYLEVRQFYNIGIFLHCFTICMLC